MKIDASRSGSNQRRGLAPTKMFMNEAGSIQSPPLASAWCSEIASLKEPEFLVRPLVSRSREAHNISVPQKGKPTDALGIRTNAS